MSANNLDEKQLNLLDCIVYALAWNDECFFGDSEKGWPFERLFSVKPLYQVKNKIKDFRKGKTRVVLEFFKDFVAVSDNRVFLTQAGRDRVAQVPAHMRKRVEKRFAANNSIPEHVRSKAKAQFLAAEGAGAADWEEEEDEKTESDSDLKEVLFIFLFYSMRLPSSHWEPGIVLV